jgi:hypothetical protein
MQWLRGLLSNAQDAARSDDSLERVPGVVADLHEAAAGDRLQAVLRHILFSAHQQYITTRSH